MPKATVIILQGRGDFVEKYEEAAEELTSRSIRVLTLDWRGQGKSGRKLKNPQRAFVQSYDEYLSDFNLFMDRIVRFASEGKVFWFAQSMGALIALLQLSKRPSKLDGIIFSAPLMDLNTTPYNKKLAQSISAFASSSGFANAYAFGQKDYDPEAADFATNPYTSDETHFNLLQKWYKQDPGLMHGGVTFGWLNATFKALDSISKLDLGHVASMPSLALLPSDDPVVPFVAQQRFANSLPKCTIKSYTGARHEVLMENESIRKQVWKDIDDFFELQIPNYIGGGKDRVKPKGIKPPKPLSQIWKPGGKM